METLTQLNREQGVTIVVVTHESDIAAYADRLLTMRDGEIISDARTRPLRPSTPVLKTPPQRTRPSTGGFWSFGLMIAAAALQAIGRNKMRSSLTMLGVFIGVAALIVMVAIGDGANEAVRKQIEGLGANVVVILPGAAHGGGMRGGAGSASTLTLADAAAIRREDAAVAQVGYLIRQQGQAQYANQNWTTTIQGVSLNYPPITNWRIAAGRAFTTEDSAGAELVAIIGQTVARQLFGASETPVGAYIQVKNTPLRVVGVLAAKGQTSFGQDQDDLVMTPFTTAERKVLGAAAPSQTQTPLNWPYLPAPNPYSLQARLTGYVNQIYVQATSAAQVRTAIDQASETLMRRHRIKPGALKDFDIRNLSQYAETAANSSRIMAMLLAAVASISLLVGGIGIMNILLVSVTERTREIGLRMAIGARRLHVLLQFPYRGRDPVGQRRPRGHRRGGRYRRNHLDRLRLAGAAVADSGGRRLPVLGGGRRVLRLLSRAKSLKPRSHRGLALRVREGAHTRQMVPFCSRPISADQRSAQLDVQAQTGELEDLVEALEIACRDSRRRRASLRISF
jgi:macrolide transport system ATP-binding/permease protein